MLTKKKKHSSEKNHKPLCCKFFSEILAAENFN